MNFSYFLCVTFAVVRFSYSECPEGQRIAHDGKCIEPFRRKLNLNNKQSKQLFDIPSGCSGGSGFAHDGGCIEPFKLKINNFSIPDITSRTNSGQNTFNLLSNGTAVLQTTRRPSSILKPTTESSKNSTGFNRTTVRTTRRYPLRVFAGPTSSPGKSEQ